MSGFEEYQRGRELFARGRPDLAQARWQRAERMGFDVKTGLEEQGMPTASERTRINGRRGDDDAERQKILEALQKAQPEHVRNPKPDIGVPETLRQPVNDQPLDLKPTIRIVDESDVGGAGDGAGGGVAGSIPAPPSSGDHVLGASGGNWVWTPIEDC